MPSIRQKPKALSIDPMPADGVGLMDLILEILKLPVDL